MSVQDILDDAAGHEDGYNLAMRSIAAASPEAKAVWELFQEFISKAQDCLNEMNPTIPLNQISKEIRQIIGLYFGNPTAKMVVSSKRSTSDWNSYQQENYKSVKLALGIYPLFLFFLTFIQGASGSKHNSVVKKLSQDYEAYRRTASTAFFTGSGLATMAAADLPPSTPSMDSESVATPSPSTPSRDSESIATPCSEFQSTPSTPMTSRSRCLTPDRYATPTASDVGNKVLLAPRAVWKAERKKRWKQIQKLVK
jgi:hypothetical protein